MPRPTDPQRQQLCELLYQVFLEIRSLGWECRAEQAGALADACHNLPKDMYQDFFDWSFARHCFESYQAQYRPSGAGGTDYVAWLAKIEAG